MVQLEGIIEEEEGEQQDPGQVVHGFGTQEYITKQDHDPGIFEVLEELCISPVRGQAEKGTSTIMGQPVINMHEHKNDIRAEQKEQEDGEIEFNLPFVLLEGFPDFQHGARHFEYDTIPVVGSSSWQRSGLSFPAHSVDDLSPHHGHFGLNVPDPVNGAVEQVI